MIGTTSPVTPAERREALVGKRVLIPLIGCHGRVLGIVHNPRSGYDELRVEYDKDGSTYTDRWPLGMLREAPEPD